MVRFRTKPTPLFSPPSLLEGPSPPMPSVHKDAHRVRISHNHKVCFHSANSNFANTQQQILLPGKLFFASGQHQRLKKPTSNIKKIDDPPSAAKDTKNTPYVPTNCGTYQGKRQRGVPQRGRGTNAWRPPGCSHPWERARSSNTPWKRWVLWVMNMCFRSGFMLHLWSTMDCGAGRWGVGLFGNWPPTVQKTNLPLHQGATERPFGERGGSAQRL